MQVAGGKRKFKIQDYSATERANPIIENITSESQTLVCICKNKNDKGQRCFKCNIFVHVCLAPGPNRGQQYECASCLNKSMDPLFQVVKVLNESYFRTQPIFRYTNVINFQFTLKPEDRQLIVELRGLHSNATSLSWPMHGGFSINDEKGNFHEMKPLLINSNRKTRREEYFLIPDDKLKIGKNYLKFKIPCLDRGRFTSSYQYEETKEYFFAINLVRRLTPNELETTTFREKRTEKTESIDILKQNNSDIEITQNKVNLMCPYTRERVKVPIRGKYCKHFSCICLQTLIATHQSSRSWNCPLCDEKINQPHVDIWVYSMLIDNQKGTEVLVREDGTYEWIQNAQADAMDLNDDSEGSVYKMAQTIQKNVPQKMDVEQSVKKPEKSSKIVEIDLDSPEHVMPQKTVQITAEELKQAGKLGLTEKELSIQREKQKKACLNQIKEKYKKNPITEAFERATRNRSDLIKGNREPQQAETMKTLQRNFKTKQQQAVSQQNQGRPRLEPIVNQPFVLYDIRSMDVREMRLDEFRRKILKGRENKYRKFIQNSQEFRKLFKEIL